MKLRELEIRQIRIPFLASFRHSSAERSETQSVLVTARGENGLVGYGESCPRSYVTGEDLGSVDAFFAAHSARIRREIDGLDSLRHWVETHAALIDRNAAAWCAIELALLDLIARTRNESVEDALGLSPLVGPFRYSAVIGEGSFDAFCKLAERYLAIGMTDLKLKVSGDLSRDRPKLEFLRRRGETLRVRLDGNNLWSSVDDALDYLSELDYPLFGFEEPLSRNRHARLAEIAARSGVPIILDESFCRIEQFDDLRGEEDRFLINLRVSKMGGILRSLRIVDEARTRGVRLIIGAQVGETSLLTRAALTVAEQTRDLLAAQEGAFGSLLLKHDLWLPSLQFAAGGQLDVREVGARGFGLNLVEIRAD
jgi:L-alanine-DL-glutamate epimerase-like enolase superfamily enzyme